MNAYEQLNNYIEQYKENTYQTINEMKSHYNCEDEYWYIIRELMDKIVELEKGNTKVKKLIHK